MDRRSALSFLGLGPAFGGFFSSFGTHSPAPAVGGYNPSTMLSTRHGVEFQKLEYAGRLADGSFDNLRKCEVHAVGQDFSHALGNLKVTKEEGLIYWKGVRRAKQDAVYYGVALFDDFGRQVCYKLFDGPIGLLRGDTLNAGYKLNVGTW